MGRQDSAPLKTESIPGFSDRIRQLRRALHREPEIGNDLPMTQRRLLDILERLPLDLTTGDKLTSITAVLRGAGGSNTGDQRRSVLLRADMDALPLQEKSELEFASVVDGVMHACGHDLHAAMLVGAAHLLCAHRDKIDGDVILMFQPGEEGHRGAELMLDEGVLDAAGIPVIAAYALHVFAADYPAGKFFSRKGTFMAASDELHLELVGQGGHGSSPHKGKDVIPATSELVLALQNMVTREFDIHDPVVVSVGSLHAGTKANILAGHSKLEITLRSFARETRSRVLDSTLRVAEGVAQTHGLDLRVHRGNGFPATVNSPGEIDFAATVARDLYGPEAFIDWPHALPGAEDFSHVADAVPAAFIGLGAGVTNPDGPPPDNHSPNVIFDETVMPLGAELLANLALQRLRRP